MKTTRHDPELREVFTHHMCPMCGAESTIERDDDAQGTEWELNHLLLECATPFMTLLRGALLSPILSKLPPPESAADYGYASNYRVQFDRVRENDVPATTWLEVERLRAALSKGLPHAFDRAPRVGPAAWSNAVRGHDRPGDEKTTFTYVNVLSLLLGGTPLDEQRERECREDAREGHDVSRHVVVDCTFRVNEAPYLRPTPRPPLTYCMPDDVAFVDQVGNPHERMVRRTVCTRTAAMLQAALPVWTHCMGLQQTHVTGGPPREDVYGALFFMSGVPLSNDAMDEEEGCEADVRNGLVLDELAQRWNSRATEVASCSDEESSENAWQEEDEEDVEGAAEHDFGAGQAF